MITPLRNTILALSCVALLGAGVGESSAQEQRSARFVSIANIEGFSGFFNVGQGTVRIVAIVPATSTDGEACLAGLRRIFEGNPSRRLRAYVVFIPLSDTDTQRDALMRGAHLSDGRIACFWDPNRVVFNALRPVLGSKAAPTSIMVFDTDAVLRDTIKAPTLSMSATTSDDEGGFDADALEAAIAERLDAFEKRQNESPAGDGQ